MCVLSRGACILIGVNKRIARGSSGGGLGGGGGGEFTECAAGLHVKKTLQRGTPTKGKWKPVNAVHELSDGLKKDVRKLQPRPSGV